MKIGIQQTALGEVSLAQCFARARRSGADGVGLCYRTAEEAHNLGTHRHVSQIQSLAERFDMAITGLHLGVLCENPSLIGPAGVIAQSQELIRQTIAVASELGQCDVVIPFWGRNRIELSKEFDTAWQAVAELAQTAEDHGVVLAVDSSQHLGQIQQFLVECDSDWIKACVDTGDATACRHDATSMIVGLGASYLAQVHIKDVLVVTGLAPDFNVRLGRGDVRFRGVAHSLLDVGYDGWLVLETPPGDDHGTIASANVDFVRNLFRLRSSSQKGSAAISTDVAVVKGLS